MNDWIGAQGEEGGTPRLVRARQRVDVWQKLKLPHLFVVELSYLPGDTSGLPAPAQYQEVGAFETSCFDVLERTGRVLLVLIETGGGRIRYFSYTDDPDWLGRELDERADVNFEMTFSAADDPKWSHYSGKMACLTD